MKKYLITAQPERENSLYYDEEGKKAEKQFAKEFFTYGDAKDFAKKLGISIDGVMNTIVVK